MNFSVLMSSYIKDKPDELQLALKSIWDDQSVKPAEIVIVKDGPLTPELDAVIEEFAQVAPIKTVPLEKNCGLGQALAIGLTHCSFDYVARMDSDDISTPDRFEKQCDYIISHPEIDIIGGGITEFIGAPENIYASRIVPLSNEAIHSYARKQSPFNHVTVMFRKDFILRIGNYEPFEKYEDYWLWIRAVHAGAECVNLPETLVLVRAGENMISRRRGYYLFCQELELIKRMAKMKFINKTSVPYLFCCRAVPRLLPVFVLKIIYKFLRK